MRVLTLLIGGVLLPSFAFAQSVYVSGNASIYTANAASSPYVVRPAPRRNGGFGARSGIGGWYLSSANWTDGWGWNGFAWPWRSVYMFGTAWNGGPGINIGSIGRPGIDHGSMGRPGIDFGSIGRPEIDQLGSSRVTRSRHLSKMNPRGTTPAPFSGGHVSHHGSLVRMVPSGHH